MDIGKVDFNNCGYIADIPTQKATLAFSIKRVILVKLFWNQRFPCRGEPKVKASHKLSQQRIDYPDSQLSPSDDYPMLMSSIL